MSDNNEPTDNPDHVDLWELRFRKEFKEQLISRLKKEHEKLRLKNERLRPLFPYSPLDSTESSSPSIGRPLFTYSPLDSAESLLSPFIDRPLFTYSPQDSTEILLSPSRRRKENEEQMMRKLDESGLPTNQEFTVCGGKTVQVPTIRLIS